MKGEEGDKIMGPLFPRLHVNDTDKGGPRAPPRNKMALYEQLRVPSQRFNSSSFAPPFPPDHSNDLVPSLSSSQQRKMLSPFHMTCQMPVHSAEKARTSDGMNLVGKSMELERKPIKHVSSENMFGTGLASECRLQRQENSSMKLSCEKVLDDADDIVVHTFDQLESVAYLKKDTHKTTPKITTSISHKIQKSLTSGNSSSRGTNLDQKLLEDTEMSGIRSRSCHETFIGNLKEISPIEKTKETKEKSPFNRIINLHNSSKNSFVRTDTNSFGFENFVNGKMVLCQENGDLSNSHTLNGIAIPISDKSLEAKSELFPKLSPRKIPGTISLSRNCFNEDNAKKNGLLVYGDAEKQDDAYEPSMADTVPSLDMSPHDIIAVIGTKNFWKARTAIANQQRLFGIQVFELHRLIKVQKLIAASPQLLLEGNNYLSKPSVKSLHDAKEPQCNKNSQPVEFKRQDDLRKINHNVEQPIEVGIAPVLPVCVEGSKRGPQDQVPQIGPHAVVPSAVPFFPNEKPSPWCFPPLANQWLVPVMSPSEGLVYKPYSGHCPPAGGFVPHLSGGCTPLGVYPLAGDFMNSAYGIPVSHQAPNMILPGPSAMVPHYFPTTYGLRPSKPIISSSAVEQVSNLSGSHANGKNMFHHSRKEAIPGNLGKFQVLKNSELQGSTVSNPSEKTHPEGGSQVPPIAAAPTASRDSQTHVIKVVPHNAMSATESAVRIFLSIQKERQQHES
ncbi:ELF3-like protein 2 isoform X1 [Zingiber officinale]|uniref:ELF3-like protein 2 isoform X1 n=1 Tax=Zingiber officinale TaxID=94328 RepID=UPI001C4C4D7C|nr:ELF3-like protein 2 isoform X1 [Zingiber officinale]XP_042427347.1 ELF3-like protein 2 isoform X1 [Zingiber officinale]